MRPSILNPSDLRSYQGAIQPRNFPGLPPDWTSESEVIPGEKGEASSRLFSILHHPEQWQGNRTLVILHGLGEHGGRYLHFPHFLGQGVDAVYCVDHRGHGRSEGLRGHIDSFDQYCQDAHQAIRRLEALLIRKFGRSEIHLLGHSMGGLIALRTLFLYPKLPVASVTVSAPLLGIRAPVPWIKKWAGKGLSKVWGTLHMNTDLNPMLISRDRDVVEAYTSDRLVHRKVTPRFYTELQAAMADTLKRNSGFEHPLLMLVPLQDDIVDSEIALKFFRNLKLRDKLLRTYSGFFHEPFNEIGKEQVFQDLRLWIRKHSPSAFREESVRAE